jgi:hypothetical protein
MTTKPTFKSGEGREICDKLQSAALLNSHAAPMPGGIRVDLEFGHHVLYSMHSERVEEIRASTEIARRLMFYLSGEQVMVRTSLLVDDKRCSCTCGMHNDLAEFCEYAAGLSVDRVMMESDLARLWDALLNHMSPPRRRYLQRQARQWSSTHNGLLACSQDIAIWHSLRLGLIRSSGVRWCAESATELAESESAADFCVSILPIRFKVFEDRARKEILSWMPSFPLSALQNLYFELSDTSQEWETAIRRIVERVRCIAAMKSVLDQTSQTGLATSKLPELPFAISEPLELSVFTSFENSPAALQTASTEAAI